MRLRALDGKTFTVYMIEGQFPKDSSYSLEWCTRELSPAHFGEHRAKYNESWDQACPLFKEYGANGQCWQRTGLDGFLDQDIAIKAFARIMKYAPPCKHVHKWRLVKRTITVKIEEVATCHAPLVTS